jgi:F-type H+-transporting ATPase subunit gamma
MAQSIKHIKNRIRGVESTKKVTNAMQMISVVKLRRIEDKLLILRPYALKLENMMHNLAGRSQELLPQYFKQRSITAEVILCVVTSDSGLCGVYNHGIIRAAEDFIKSNSEKKVKLILVGQKGVNYFRGKNIPIINSYVGLNGKFSQNFCDKITLELKQLFLDGKADAIYLAYAYFENSIVQRPLIQRLLNIESRGANCVEYIAEPDLESILVDLVPKYLLIKMRLVFLEAFTSEHAARTVSMKTATDNAKDLLEGLVLLRNKVRQAGITQDILEISSSVEALRG